MNNNEKLFRIIAVSGLVLGVVALVRYELVIQAFHETTEAFHQFQVDLQFADIVDNYDDNSGEPE